MKYSYNIFISIPVGCSYFFIILVCIIFIFTFKFRWYSPYRSYGICNCMDFGNPTDLKIISKSIPKFVITGLMDLESVKSVIHPDPLSIPNKH